MVVVLTISVVAGAVSLVLSSVVFRASRDRADNRIFAAMSALSGVAIMAIGAAYREHVNFEAGAIAYRLGIASEFLVSWFLVLFAYAFPFGRRPSSRTWALCAATTGAFCAYALWGDWHSTLWLRWALFLPDLATLVLTYRAWKSLGAVRERTAIGVVGGTVVVRWLLGFAVFGSRYPVNVESLGAMPVLVNHLIQTVVQVLVIGISILRLHLMGIRRAFRGAVIPLGLGVFLSLYGVLCLILADSLIRYFGNAGTVLAVLIPLLSLGWAVWTFGDSLRELVDGLDPVNQQRRALLERVLSVTGQILDPEAVLAMVKAAVCEVVPDGSIAFAKSSENRVLPGISRALSRDVEKVLLDARESTLVGLSLSGPELAESRMGLDRSALVAVRGQAKLLGAFEIKANAAIGHYELDTIRALADHLAVKFENHALYSSLGRAGRELASIKSFLEDLIESLPSGIVGLVGPELRVRLWNPSEERRTGISKNDAIGKKYLEELQAQPIDDAIAKALKESPRDVVLLSDVGWGQGENRRSLDVTIAPLRSKQSSDGGYVLIFNDVMQKKTLQLELEENRRLAALGRFAAAIAHDIRTPLSSIRMSVQILRSRVDLPPDDMEYFDLTLEAIGRLGREVEELLDFTKPIVLRAEDVRVSDILEDVRDTVAARAIEREVEVRLNVDSSLSVPVDEMRVRQALVNLVDNALQATMPGGVVRLEAERQGEQVVIRVKDSGIGIDEKNLERIWDPFFTTRPDGTGLGLAIVKKTITAHGGAIYVRSEPGVETCFELALPATRATEVFVVLDDCGRREGESYARKFAQNG
jgi:signal transduction histidine kinase